MPTQQVQKISRRVATQSRACKPWVFAHKALDARVQIGEIAAPTSRDPNLLTELFGVVDERHAQTPLAGNSSAVHAGRACANDQNIKIHDESVYSPARTQST